MSRSINYCYLKIVLLLLILSCCSLSALAQRNNLSEQIAEERKRVIDSIENICKIYYNYLQLNDYTIDIEYVPFDAKTFDTNYLYNEVEVLNLIQSKRPDLIDSTLRTIKRVYSKVIEKEKNNIESNAIVQFANQEALKFPKWFYNLSGYFLSSYDSTVYNNFEWELDSNGYFWKHEKVDDTISHTINDPWNNLKDIYDLKTKFRNYSRKCLILYSNLCYFNTDSLTCTTPDVLYYMYKASNLKDSAKKKYFDLNYRIDGLVRSPFYKSDRLSPYLVKLLNKCMNEDKSFLPTNYHNLVNDVPLSVSQTAETHKYLWMYNDMDSIYISPYLIRAVFINLLENQRFNSMLSRYDIIQKKWKDSRQFDVKDIRPIINNFENGFVSNFRFLIGHELAHIYLGNGVSPSLDEFACDCYSLHYLSSNHKDISLGLFEDIVKRSVEEGALNLWGIDSNTSGQLQIQRINIIKQMNGVYNCKAD